MTELRGLTSTEEDFTEAQWDVNGCGEALESEVLKASGCFELL